MSDAPVDPLRMSMVRALGAVAAGEPVAADDLAALEARGLLAAGALTDDVASAGEAVAHPLATLELMIRRGPTRLDGIGWAGEFTSIVAFPDPATGDDPQCTLLVEESVALTAALARFLEIGPRAETLPECFAVVSRGLLEEVTGAGGPIDAASALGLLGVDEAHPLASLLAPRVVHWRVDARLTESGERLSCEVVDCGKPGVWIVGPLGEASDEVALIASSPSGAWRMLSSVLPGTYRGVWPALELPELVEYLAD